MGLGGLSEGGPVVAAFGNVDRILNALDASIRTPITAAFEYVMRELSLGDSAKAENFALYRISGTTHATANAEFSITHGLDHAPSKLIPFLQLDSTGGQIVSLKVSRISDAKRIYLTSPSTGAAFVAYLE